MTHTAQTPKQSITPQWQFWIDRGGTFTDIVARRPDGTLVTHKLLSENPERYADAAVAGIRHLLSLNGDEVIPANLVAAVKMGTTVATNALLERKGEPTVLCITRGFGDALRIAYQNRPRIFDRHIVLPEMLHGAVIEVDERIGAQGDLVTPLDEAAVQTALQAAFEQGYRATAIVLMHGYRYPAHEQRIAVLALQIGYTQISISHQVSPLMKLIPRGDTTVVDAYLSPVLRRYVDQVTTALPDVPLLFMQSNGGLTEPQRFQGKDAILSGPAGGIVGMVQTSMLAGFNKLIGFDMGGTSTDVSHYASNLGLVNAGDYERVYETLVAGVRVRAPMMSIHTVAAGGGSILHFDGQRYRVGPDSAGANPGPASYRRGGPLTVTDCNVLLGRIQPDYFPKMFGITADQMLDSEAVRRGFDALGDQIAQATGQRQSPEQIAEGFLAIAVQNMANAIKKISVQRGHDVSDYVLTTFGGAGGQHACLVADALGMKKVFLHPLAGVLSAYGMGLADRSVMRERAIERELNAASLVEVEQALKDLTTLTQAALNGESAKIARADTASANTASANTMTFKRQVHLRYVGTDTALAVTHADPDTMRAEFEWAYRQRYAFLMPDRPLIIEAVVVEAIARSAAPQERAPVHAERVASLQPTAMVAMFVNGAWCNEPLYQRTALQPGDCIAGPALIAEANSTTIVDAEWQAEVTAFDHLVLTRMAAQSGMRTLNAGVHDRPDPVLLEVFNNLFMGIAEQMGLRLQNTAHSVNIKERLDFSCALFDAAGNLIANAPHIPVHLGSMGESIKTVIHANAGRMQAGDVYVLNDPYRGGTHLPDVTVITAVYLELSAEPLFYVGSRGHHADIGGITPGSMPPGSTHIDEEGVLFDNVKLVDGVTGTLREAEIRALLGHAKYPARNPDQNIADLRAQIAANQKGVDELRGMVAHYGLAMVQAYMGHVQDNAEAAVRRVIGQLHDGRFELPLDNGAIICVAVTVDAEQREVVIDFTGTSAQLSNNFNAPSAICMAAVLYVFRTLVDDDIPLNAGCLRPLRVIIPEGSMLNPRHPAAVVAGNVETSSCITNALYGALGVMASAQSTMNNFTFGNARYQYYETIAGGSGAGPGFNGTDVVQTHMTNSRLTDPEVLEFRYPVRLESYTIRLGSGGAGRWHGGHGGVRQIRFLEPMTAAIISNNRIHAPFGMAGGEPGATGHNWMLRHDGRIENLLATDSTELETGDVFVIETPGGGGFGLV